MPFSLSLLKWLSIMEVDSGATGFILPLGGCAFEFREDFAAMLVKPGTASVGDSSCSLTLNGSPHVGISRPLGRRVGLIMLRAMICSSAATSFMPAHVADGNPRAVQTFSHSCAGRARR